MATDPAVAPEDELELIHVVVVRAQRSASGLIGPVHLRTGVGRTARAEHIGATEDHPVELDGELRSGTGESHGLLLAQRVNEATQDQH
jgi:hypothetical protein